MRVGLVLAATAIDSSGEWLAAIVAVVAAAVYVAGMALQQRGNLLVMERAATAGTPGDTGARKVLSNGVWWAGMGVMVAGFVLHATALSLGSLTIVQPLQVSEIIFMLPAGAWVTHVAVSRRDWLSAATVAVGLGVFLVASQPGEGSDVTTGGSWPAAFFAVAALAVALFLVAQRLPTYKAALLGAMTGSIYGLQAAVLKQATGQLSGAELADVLTWWAIPAVVAINVTAIVGQNLAMRAGRLSAALSTLTVVTPLVSTVIGIWLFGESLSTEPLNLALAGLGIIATVVGVVLLAASPALLAAEGATEAEEEAAEEVAAEAAKVEGEVVGEVATVAGTVAGKVEGEVVGEVAGTVEHVAKKVEGEVAAEAAKVEGEVDRIL